MPKIKRTWRGKRFNISQASLKIGKSAGYLSQLWLNCRECYEYLESLHENPVYAYHLFLQKRDAVNTKIEEIYFELREKKQLSKFGEHLVQSGIYRNRLSFATKFQNFFNVERKLGFKTIMLHAKIVNEYERYKCDMNMHDVAKVLAKACEIGATLRKRRELKRFAEMFSAQHECSCSAVIRTMDAYITFDSAVVPRESLVSRAEKIAVYFENEYKSVPKPNAAFARNRIVMVGAA